MKLPEVVRAFLAAQNTLTLATSNADGSPHACDLFYACTADVFYFLSDPKTQHIRNLVREPRVSATIHGVSEGWQDIRGIQIVGIAARVDNRRERARAFTRYLAKYAFVRETLPRVEMLGHLHEIFGVVDLYKLTPRWLRWIDNTRGFGYKEEGGIQNSYPIQRRMQMRTKLLFLFVVLALLAALMLNAPAHAQPGDFQGTVVVTDTPSPTLTATITPTSTLTATTTLTPTLSPVVVSPTAMPTPTLFPLAMWTPLPIPTFSFQPVLPRLLNPCLGCRPADAPPKEPREPAADKW